MRDTKNKISNKEVDLSLVRRSKKGDYRAFDLLVLKYQSRLISIAFKYVKERQLAEDITQETFFRVWKNRKSLIPEKSFFSLIARISTNLCYDHFS